MKEKRLRFHVQHVLSGLKVVATERRESIEYCGAEEDESFCGYAPAPGDSESESCRCPSSSSDSDSSNNEGPAKQIDYGIDM